MLMKNVTMSVGISLTLMKVVGFWGPELRGNKKTLYDCYGFCQFMFLLGTYLIIQSVDLFMIWGDLPLMTGVSFLLFTNLAQATKIFYTVRRRQQVLSIVKGADEALRAVDSEEARKIVKSCNRETLFLQMTFYFLTFITMLGWATSAEKDQLPLRAWYPYDTSLSPAYELTYMHQIGALYLAAFLNVCKDALVTSLLAQCRCRLRLLGLALRTLYPYDTSLSPAYELTYMHQIGALYLAAFLNVCKDALVTSLLAQCRCRLRLLGLALRTLCQGIDVSAKYCLSPDEETVVKARLSRCVKDHQLALDAAQQIQNCFSEQIFAQFNVSLVIICVTAFQLVSQTGNLVRLISMGTYLLNMMFQVFLYCYQGNQLSEESSEIAGAAYEAPWYLMSSSIRSSLLIIMVRSRRVVKITAGSFTTLSLASFMAIIKASYSLFTLLQQVEEKD